MLKKFFVIVFITFFSGTLIGAQNTNNCPCLSGQPLNQNDIILLEGKVDLSSWLAGAGSPVLTLVQLNGEKVPVQIAPFWFLRNQKFPFKSGDSITINALNISLGQTVRTVALSIRSTDGKELKLRDEYGCPLWGAGRRMPENRQLVDSPPSGTAAWGQRAFGMGRGRGQCWRVTVP
jgi:hypothetical protein